MRPLRQGDVILVPIREYPSYGIEQVTGTKLHHLTLAKGEVTGHSHRIGNGEAELYEEAGTLYLRVLGASATLVHEEHQAIDVAQGDWLVKIQREYEPEGWRYVAD